MHSMNDYTKQFKTDLQMIAKVNESEKQSLLQLARTKGCEGWTAFVRLLAHAKKVKIES